MHALRLLVVTCLSMLVLAACATGAGQQTPPPAHSQAAVDDYLIGIDDIVQITVWRNPELGITVPVRPDGRISVPLIGDVAAGGLTPAAVAADVRKSSALTSATRKSQSSSPICAATNTSREFA